MFGVIWDFGWYTRVFVAPVCVVYMACVSQVWILGVGARTR